MKKLFMALIMGFLASSAFALDGNTSIENYSKARKLLLDIVHADHRMTIYCNAAYDTDSTVHLPVGFTTPSHEQRAHRMEVEHSVPAENFGRFFREWREGHPQCVDESNKLFKGRKCASLSSQQFRYMESDLYNLFPSIGAVNAIRSNYNYAELSGVPPTFGSCPMKVYDRKAEPPDGAKGQVARSALYFEAAYGPQYFRLSKQQKKLFWAWNVKFPVTAWECKRTKRIEKLQGNENPFVKHPCISAGLW